MRRVIFREKKFMNTIIAITVIQDNVGTIEINEALEDAFFQFEKVVEKYTRFNNTSELAKLNKSNSPYRVSKEFFELIEFMLSMSKRTNGAFDPTIIDFLEVYGYDKDYDFSKLDNPNLDSFVKNVKEKRGYWDQIKLDKDNSTIHLPQNTKIDLGSVGKGFAIDLAFNTLEKVSNNFLINAGGDIRAKGKNYENRWWTINLKGKDGSNGAIELKNQSLSSSGSWARKVKQFHHLIDPSTGKPAEKKYSTVFTLGKNSLITDAWATALFILGEETEESKKDVLALFV